MKPLKERLPLIDAAIDELKGAFPPTAIGYSGRGYYSKGDFANILHGVNIGDICTRDEFNQRAKELGYINGYKYGVEYETKCEKPDLPDDVQIEQYIKAYPNPIWWPIKDTVGGAAWGGCLRFRIVDERYKPKEQDMSDWYEKSERPPVGTKLMGSRIMSQDGVKEWFDFPRYEVVAHHSNGKTFFVDVLDGKGGYLGTQKFDVGCDQYKPLRTETDKLVEQMCNDAIVGRDKDVELNPAIVAAIERLAEQGYRKIKPMSEGEFMKQCVDICDHGDTRLYRAGCRFLDGDSNE